MRPTRLRLRNFGPFRDAEVDFSALESMFLITGRTGSGKSALFDAITYALYGRFAGGRRSVRLETMVCDFAGRGEDSFVELEFRAGGGLYRARRTLPTLPKRGKTLRPTELSLEAEDGGVWRPFKGHTSEQLTETIEREIVRLKYDEFNQIVLLPQGEFARFLKQKSSDRAETLRKIFPIDALALAVEKVREKAKAARAELSDAERRLSEAGAAGTAEELSRRIGELSAELSAAEAERVSAESERGAAERRLAEAKAQAERARRHEEARRRLSTLEAERGEIERGEEALEESRRAHSLMPAIARSEAAERRLCEARRESAAAERAAADAAAERARLSADDEAVAALSARLSDYERRISALNEALSLAAGLSLALSEAAAAEEAAKAAEARAASARSARDALSRRLSEAAEGAGLGAEGIASEGAAAVVAALASRAHSLSAELSGRERELSSAKSLAAARAELSEAEAEAADAERSLKAAERTLLATKSVLDDLLAAEEERNRRNSAAALARTLVAGSPCPVCGSTAHPSPATEDGVSLSDKIEAQRKHLSEAERAERAAKEISARANEKAAVRRGRTAELSAGSGGGSESVEEAEEAAAKARIAAAEAAEAAEAARRTAAELSRAEAELSSAERSATAAEAEAARARAVAGEREKAAAANADGLAPADEAAIRAELSALAVRAEEARARIGAHEAAKSRAALSAERAAAAAEGAARQIGAAEAEAAAANAEFASLLAGTGFGSADGARRAAMEKTSEDALRQRIGRWRADSEAARAVAETTGGTEGAEEIGRRAAAESERIGALDGRLNALARRAENAAAEKRAAEDALARLGEAEGRLRAAERDGAAYIALAEDLAGGARKIPFDSWVLATYFSEVLDYANERFRELSSGRYTLKLQQTRGAGQHGLDIAVCDSFTGQDRDPATLSGGETFQASISLALALTDVVCARTGGVRLDALFIDEGFGSLDAESLDSALATLHSIRKERTVGVISHVESMKTEIRSHVEVEKGGQGISTIRTN